MPTKKVKYITTEPVAQERLTKKKAIAKRKAGKIGRMPNCPNCGKPKDKCICGRPSVITKAVITKLEAAFSYGATDEEACMLADISPDALYDFCKENEAFAVRKELLKEQPNLAARKMIVNALHGRAITDPDGKVIKKPRLWLAQWYLERKKRKEFATLQEFGTDEDTVNSIAALFGNVDNRRMSKDGNRSRGKKAA